MNYRYFNKILQLVYKKSPLQKKKIKKYLKTQDEHFFYLAEKFARNYIDYLKSQNISLEYAVDAYLKMCSDMIKSQIYFMKTGKYPMESAEHAYTNVYGNLKEMKSYMIGLAISQFLWATHYEMYEFLLNALNKFKNEIKDYLEIGPGHGLFLKNAIEILNKNVSFTAVDISEVSMNITKSIVNKLVGDEIKVRYIIKNMLKINIKKKYDFIAMGEVLEHVNYPEMLLSKFNKLLSDNGHGFISTCVNCPTIDHVYQYKCVNEIREMLNNNGLIIKDELILPVEDLPMDEIIKKKIAINYCAIVRRHKK